jgi:hypothetical protein
MGRLRQFLSDMFAMVLMGVGISTTRPRQRKLDLQGLVSASADGPGAGGNSRERWILTNCAATNVNFKGQQAVRLEARGREGLAWIERLRFPVSKIDLDIAATPQAVGVAFRVRNERDFEAICFHVGNEVRKEGEQQRVLLRYLARGFAADSGRQEDSEAEFFIPFSQSGEWFKSRITISKDVIAVFINGSNIPSLRLRNVEGEETSASVGLWVGGGSPALIADFRAHEVRGDIESQIKRIMGRR